MENQSKVLLVDDDRNISELIKMYLEKEGYECTQVYNGKEAIDNIDQNFELIILDIMLPIINGWDVLKEIRKKYATPVIMLTAKGETFDKVLGLELGADDYMVKPFDPKELSARVKAVLRRYKSLEAAKVLNFDKLIIDMDKFQIILKGNIVEMPPKELELLYFLASNPNKVYTREQLLNEIWGYDFVGDSRTVDVHVKRLREKIDTDDVNWSLKTVWGVGYKFEVK
ncbi:transcriptional regulatory protein SrrA [Oxobacter pfennigii]|uniref:Stage 0 sporulation protein A homolog n=1 Tax=Oxobacter pfennigii TaxID=36849 RepID=A0A0P8W2Q0_9CLOT|nr:response regulator transcription factor [Oxobacter pfennigii]KPU42790.1 transcriptional regulatory protein SrrA [Oxobacter pfennigii]